MLQFHAAHRNLVLDSQTYYPNLTDDVIAGGPLRFDGCFLDVPTGPGLGVELDPTGSRTTPRTTRARWREGRRRAPEDPYYDRDYLIRAGDDRDGTARRQGGGGDGAGSGMGRAGSVAFAREGAAVVLADIDPERGESGRQSIRARPADARWPCRPTSHRGRHRRRWSSGPWLSSAPSTCSTTAPSTSTS